MSGNARPDNQEEKQDVLCNHCGQAFSTFLHQMEEHNAKVVCPSCGKPHLPATKKTKPSTRKN